MSPQKRSRSNTWNLRRWLIALLAGVAIAAFSYFALGDQGPRYGGRYDEIADEIGDNLHFGRHFTWAVTTETIKDVRPTLRPTDVDVLARMLADERGTVSVAAGGLLVLMGPAGAEALRRASASENARASLAAQSALLHLKQCQDPAITNLDREVCPK